jgi:hypothetical protein
MFTGESRGMYDVLWLDSERKFHDCTLIILVQFAKVFQK